ncbi:MAG: hypothetical protein IJ532_08830 [Alphaproteobacteria bacterium]|nr:hypothetical protein [Alphaproteobacteria bacterium]
MKKFILILGMIITVGVFAIFSHNQNKITLPKPIEKGFKNPLFYRPLKAYSDTWHNVLTPYSITVFQDPVDKSKLHNVLAESYSCSLIENEYDHIKYDCYICADVITYQPCHRECITYKIREYDVKMNWYMIKKGVCDNEISSETRVIDLN